MAAALSDWYRTGSKIALERYSETALRRVWRAQDRRRGEEGVGPSPERPRALDQRGAAATIRVSGVKAEPHMVPVLKWGPASCAGNGARLDVADEVDATLIIVGSQGMARARRLLGSVPNKVSHAAKTNVLIVSTHK